MRNVGNNARLAPDRLFAPLADSIPLHEDLFNDNQSAGQGLPGLEE
jgi:hypothetical protein